VTGTKAKGNPYNKKNYVCLHMLGIHIYLQTYFIPVQIYLQTYPFPLTNFPTFLFFEMVENLFI
jgi:hypothetical protein